ncbi:MAG: hypothetical protein VX498_12210, partial [Myxococcota bacterium]|nr:hypothetical protein [Myxococcota bacterium]
MLGSYLHRRTVACAIAALGVLFSACGTGSDSGDPPEAPVALLSVLNEDPILAVGDIIYLDGSESHLGANTDGLDLSLSYHWAVASRPIDSALIDEDLTALQDDESNADPSRVSITPDVQGLYGVTLQVSDGERVSDLALATLEIGGGNNCHIADAGADLIAQTGVPVT